MKTNVIIAILFLLASICIPLCAVLVWFDQWFLVAKLLSSSILIIAFIVVYITIIEPSINKKKSGNNLPN